MPADRSRIANVYVSSVYVDALGQKYEYAYILHLPSRLDVPSAGRISLEGATHG
jgi:hypothetical protein